ncbi:quinonoid dihydropteridine reductase [Trypanosoma conorhini]|uniref:Dihydropteridine reductase n=1 Tax=Trypanosoma conorhini TaxID=83891 RepID=A0A422NEW0_9TRYP|nr:quinonoid dihydropteridine reductase [Trypanosoma conorhini]RNF04000.1 quinonoid dihydropteridine reductase [Trypanosoma conorhini]
MLPRRGLVLGACGALGQAVTNALLERQWSVVGVDVVPKNSPTNSYAHVVLNAADSAETQQGVILGAVASGAVLNAVINVAGGWAGGGAADSASCCAMESMIRQTLFSSMAAAHVASQRGGKSCLLLLPGAAAALRPTPGMLGYGAAKAGVHHLTKSLAAGPQQLPEGACVLALLPTILATPANRQAMPDTDTSSWTPLGTAAEIIAEWANGVNRPLSGSLVLLKTSHGKTKWIVAE